MTHWHLDRGRLLAGGVWTEVAAGAGEDAQPLHVHHFPSRQGVLGVFDGNGGAGGTATRRSADGTVRTDAWLAARIARIALESWFCWSVRPGGRPDPGALEAHLAELLAAVGPARASRLAGRMNKALPTTMAAVRYRMLRGGLECTALWAGDSRAYLLSPEHGLQALTRDHTEEQDGLVQLLEDPPLTNVINADVPFFVESREVAAVYPCLLVCATDGFFGYVHTPADFEYRLLAHLRVSGSVDEWCRRLAGDVRSYTGDDATLSLVAFGFRGFRALAAAFTGRVRELENWLYRDSRSAEPGWRQAVWERYRPDYEGLLVPAGRKRR